MRIVNELDRAVEYELKAGPARMTMSTCALEPGEVEEWRSPYRGLNPSCELRVTVGDELWKVEALATASVRITPGGLVVG